MLGLTTTTVMQFALLVTGGSEYMEAYNKADVEGKPLLVLVGAQWCPGCRVMKNEAMPELQRRGGLKNVAFVEVDADAKPELCRKLLRGSAIPQLVLYTRSGKLWRRTQLTGAHSPTEIRNFLKREIAAGRVVDRKASPKKVDASQVVHKSSGQQ